MGSLFVLSSGAAVTWAHHAILAGKEKRAVYALVATVSLALVFTGFQGMEYYQAPFTISDSIYGSTFFLATGFHGFHVIIGTLLLGSRTRWSKERGGPDSGTEPYDARVSRTVPLRRV